MVKKSASASDHAQEEELSVVILKFKGSGETVRKGMDVVGQAIAALGPGPVTVVRSVNGRKPAAALTAAPETIETEAVDDVEAETDETDEQETDGAAPAKPKAPAKPRKFEFNSKISDNATTPLKDFVASAIRRRSTKGISSSVCGCRLPPALTSSPPPMSGPASRCWTGRSWRTSPSQ